MLAQPILGFIAIAVFVATLLWAIGYSVVAMTSRKRRRRDRRRR
jgi:hypothetical protein